jgi:hypothetical protein
MGIVNRPTAAASTKSWVAIWLGCMDASLSRSHKAPYGHHNNNKPFTHKIQRYESGLEKMGPTMHQPSCGHGFTWRERGFVQPTVYQYSGTIDNNFLGGTPRECKTIAQAWRLKNGWNR